MFTYSHVKCSHVRMLECSHIPILECSHVRMFKFHIFGDEMMLGLIIIGSIVACKLHHILIIDMNSHFRVRNLIEENIVVVIKVGMWSTHTEIAVSNITDWLDACVITIFGFR